VSPPLVSCPRKLVESRAISASKRHAHTQRTESRLYPGPVSQIRIRASAPLEPHRTEIISCTPPIVRYGGRFRDRSRATPASTPEELNRRAREGHLDFRAIRSARNSSESRAPSDVGWKSSHSIPDLDPGPAAERVAGRDGPHRRFVRRFPSE